jgi:hypothetical protein
VVRTVTTMRTVTPPSSTAAAPVVAPTTTSGGSNPTADPSPTDPYADCADKGTCPLTVARAHTVAVSMAAQIAQGSPSGVSGCTQQSPRKVSCDYWINNGTGEYACHYVATLTIVQPTYQRDLQFEDGPAGTCQ